MDATTYFEKKGKGLTTLKLSGDTDVVTIYIKQFSPEDGSELSPQTDSVSISKIEQEIADMKERIKQSETFVAELKLVK